METKVRDLIKEKGATIYSVKPEQTVYEAIQVLVNNNIGALLVIDGNDKIVGIFSERDILKQAMRRSDQLKTTTVKSVMTTDLIIGLPEDEVGYLMGIMTENKVRHIPIISKEGKALGMISIGDLVKTQLHDAKYENRYLKDYIIGKYPA